MSNNPDCSCSDQPRTLGEASDFFKRKVSEEAIRKALAAGALKGRNFGGNVGWMTTTGALLEWVNNGNGKDGGDVDEK